MCYKMFVYFRLLFVSINFLNKNWPHQIFFKFKSILQLLYIILTMRTLPCYTSIIGWMTTGLQKPITNPGHHKKPEKQSSVKMDECTE